MLTCGMSRCVRMDRCKPGVTVPNMTVYICILDTAR